MAYGLMEWMVGMTPWILSAWMMLFLFPFIVLWIMGVLWATADVVKREDLDAGNKIIWVLVIWLLWFVGIVVYFFFGRRQRGILFAERARVESAFDILKKRYAKGEISREEYLQMKADLERK
ncbi:MAG: PLDc N-terminal domain-containing protein [Candidatus Hydrothermarchaeales archaeon]